MPAANPLYDLVLMLDTSADDARRAEILESVRTAVSAAGEIVNSQDWGARTLSFEIDKKKDAEYHLLQFHATPDLLSQLDRTLRITDEVVRFRVIKLAPGTPAPPEQRAEPRASGDGSAEDVAPLDEDADGSAEDVAGSAEDVAGSAEDVAGSAEEPAYEAAALSALGESDDSDS